MKAKMNIQKVSESMYEKLKYDWAMQMVDLAKAEGLDVKLVQRLFLQFMGIEVRRDVVQNDYAAFDSQWAHDIMRHEKIKILF